MDRIIQQTDNDAFSSKICAIECKYLPPPQDALLDARGNKDIQELYRGFAEMHNEYYAQLKEESRNVYGRIRRMTRNPFPVMNYGTYLRTLAIDTTALKFIEGIPQGTEFQIVNLGCGSDLRSSQYLGAFPSLKRFVDIDFTDAIELKRRILDRPGPLHTLTEQFGDRYVIFEGDLRELKGTMEKLQSVLDPALPTVFITECVLCYMTDNDSQQLITTIMETFSKAMWVSYDPIGGSAPGDRFGTIMKQNLMDSRNLDMPTLLQYNSKDNFATRWENCKTVKSEVNVRDMWDFLESSITTKEKGRLRSLQFLDEIEELRVMQSHYVILSVTWGC